MHISIHKSLIHKQLVLGAEKTALKYLSAFVFILIAPNALRLWNYPLFSIIGILFALLFWLLGIWFLRMLARRDKQFFAIFFRSLRYQRLYLAKTENSFKQKWRWHRNWNS
jgi:type IV secretory pathway TrbD component